MAMPSLRGSLSRRESQSPKCEEPCRPRLKSHQSHWNGGLLNALPQILLVPAEALPPPLKLVDFAPLRQLVVQWQRVWRLSALI